MSDNLTAQQLQTFLNSLLQANMSNRSWVDFWNPNTPTNRVFQNQMFNHMKKNSRVMFKQILQEHRVMFEQNRNMTFPENFQSEIPRIVEEFMRLMSPQATEAVADAPIRHAVCAGGCAVAEAYIPTDDGFPSSLDRSGWGVPAPRAQRMGSVSESSDDTRKKCQYAGGNCRFHATWGGCRNIHPENDPIRGELPKKGGPTIMVCRNGPSCRHGDKCRFPHPKNPSCLIEQKETKFGPILTAKVCTLKKCNETNCSCAHLPQDVIEKALQRKKDAFSKSSRGGVACSVIASPAVACSAVDCNSVLEADEVASLTGELSKISLKNPHHGGGAHACSLPIESCRVVEGNLLRLLDQNNFDDSSELARQLLPSAPPLELWSFGQWSSFVHPQTEVSYFQNENTGGVQFKPPNFFQDNFPACALNAVCIVACQQVSSRVPKRQFDAVQLGASCAVACQLVHSRPAKRQFDADQPSSSCAVVRLYAEQEDESQSPKPTKRFADSDSCTESSKKPRE
jgi:hypothetical protein